MKTCPMCQQVYPDDAPDFCGKDGTPLTASSSYGPTPPAEPAPWRPPGAGFAPATPYAAKPVDGGISKIAMTLGIVASSAFALGLLITVIEEKSHRPSVGAAKIVSILYFLMVPLCVTAINTSIVALVMANQQSFPKTKGWVGLWLGIIPLIIFITIILTIGARTGL